MRAAVAGTGHTFEIMAISPFGDPQPFSPAGTAPPAAPRAAWSPRAIACACVLLTILPAGIMYALNFDRLGAPEKKKPALIGVLVISTVLYGIAIISTIEPAWLPSFNDRSIRFFNGLMTLMMARYFYVMQAPLFARHLREGGKKAAVLPYYFKTLGVALLLLIPVFGYLVWDTQKDDEAFQQGYALLQKERYKDAEPIFARLHAKDPDDNDVTINLAVVYVNTKRYEKAKEELKSVERTAPNDTSLKILQKVIQEHDAEGGE